MMFHRQLTVIATSVVIAAALAGCGPSAEQIAMSKALSSRVDPHADFNSSASFLRKYVDKYDADYVMWAMDYSSLCMMGGNYDAAKKELLKCFGDISKRQDKKKETAAALSAESLKVFKGEPFERAMLCTYLGMLHYMEGDYNNARIFFRQADLADDRSANNMKAYRNDFRLAHFWLGRTFMKLGKPDDARIFFERANQRIPRKGEDREAKAYRRSHERARKKRCRLEKKSFQIATKGKQPVAGAIEMSGCLAAAEMPEVVEAAAVGCEEDPVLLKADTMQQFCSTDFQKEVNLVLVIESGQGPIKTLVGENQCIDKIVRAPYPERETMVYLSGHKAGKAYRMLDMFHQADTRGTTEKDTAQIVKGITQSILRRLPYIGYVAAYWNVQADWRYWRLLPGEVHVYAAKVQPGNYTVQVQSMDANNRLLPRYSLTRYHVPVRAGEENVYLLHTTAEADNTYVAATK